MIVACFQPCLDFIWIPISSALLSFLQDNTGDALTWLRNWAAQRIPGFGATGRVVPLPSSSPSIVGRENTLAKVRCLLDSKEPEIIGIYGMGGVGKTTLLKAINNEFFQTRSRKFDVVIFVTVSNDVNIENIQTEIGARLGFSSDPNQGPRLPPDPKQKREKLCEILVQKKFLLLLDDLWDRLDLAKVGIPISLTSTKGSKIVFTTRSTIVCNAMDAAKSKVKLQVLSPEKSWELFCEKLGKREEKEWNDSTKSIARKVVERCGGLPLAIITVGRAMADTTGIGEWELALTMLPELMADNATNVLTVLKFSFDRLKDRRLKQCLLYCALYPEDRNILVSDLICHWIGEGFLERERFQSIDEAYNFGQATITALKGACLLEDDEERGEYVKLHDVVREMVLWITDRSYREEESVFLVGSGKEVVNATISDKWTDATRISLIWGACKKLPNTPHCKNLRTLLLSRNNDLSQIPERFFQFMSLLAVLDLSYTSIRCLPQEIGLLVELRHLNLSYTNLESLPKEVGKLTKLRMLDLCHNESLRSISKEAISSLSCLQVLCAIGLEYDWIGGRMNDDAEITGDKACLADLESLKQLGILRLNIEIKCDTDLLALLNLRRLYTVIRSLELSLESRLSFFDMSGFLGAFKGLKFLELEGCESVEQLIFPIDRHTKLEILGLSDLPRAKFSWKDCIGFMNLKTLSLSSCNTLVEITWVGELPCLETITLSSCSRMVEVITITGTHYKGSSLFPRLRHVDLWYMNRLEGICTKPLSLPCLEKVWVFNCRKMRKLPFDSHSAQNIKEIMGSQEWWDGLKWESDDTRLIFIPYFKIWKTRHL